MNIHRIKKNDTNIGFNGLELMSVDGCQQRWGRFG